MNRRYTVMLTSAAAVAVTAGVVVAPIAASASPASKPPVVQVHLKAHKTTLSRTSLHAGLITFTVHAAKEHLLQIARLHSGYSLADANRDIQGGFQGHAADIRRADKNVTFAGGAEGKPGKPGRFTTTLRRGSWVAINFDTGAHKFFTVHGSKAHRARPATSSRITMLTYGFDTITKVLPRSGTTRLGNVSDQPHFIVFQRIKAGVTNKQLLKAFASNSKPSFVLKGSTDSGVLSPYKTIQLHYKLPAGHYVIACFWPDDETGMTHASMGMYKRVTLR